MQCQIMEFSIYKVNRTYAESKLGMADIPEIGGEDYEKITGCR